jgi:hypothetical protein
MGDNKLRFWQVVLSSGYRTLASKPIHDSVATSPKDRLLAFGLADSVSLWDLNSGAFLTELESVGQSVAFESSGALLTSGSVGLLRWPIQRDLAIPNLLRIGPPEKLALPSRGNIAASADGRVLASAGSRTTGSRGLVWHRDMPAPPLQLPFHEDPRNIGISPDGQWVATGSHFGTNVIISSARTGERVKELPVEGGSFVRFSPDGRWLATTGGRCRLWNIASWNEGAYIGGTEVAFSPDNKLIAVETGHGIIRLVDPETGQDYARLEDPNQERSYRLCFSQDGTQLITFTLSRSVRVWDLRSIRQQLARMDLDWNLPQYSSTQTERDSKPLHVEVDRGELLNRKLAEARNHDAWLLAKLPNRDSRRAIELAREAIQLAPEVGNYWNTLGVACFRAGQWDESIRALDKSILLMAGKNESFNTFFLAMAYWQQHNTEQAIKLYDQAVTWMEKNKAGLKQEHAEELYRFRAEAAALLEVKSKK